MAFQEGAKQTMNSSTDVCHFPTGIAAFLNHAEIDPY